jgi:hypothetical protein
MRNSVVAPVLALVALSATGCATVFNEDVRMVSVASNPAGGIVYVDGHKRGTTPIMVPVSNYQDHRIVVQAPGGQPQTCELRTSVGALWIVLDVVTGVWPLVVDWVTGQWAGLDQTACWVDLGPGAAPDGPGGWDNAPGAPPSGGDGGGFGSPPPGSPPPPPPGAPR